jgi:hypothetical protein
MGILMSGLQERELYYLSGDDQELADEIRERIKQAKHYFENKVKAPPEIVKKRD